MEVINKAHGHELPLSSGYVVFVKPLPPYYKDLVDQQLPIPVYPTRKILLHAGDEVDWPYEPLDEPVQEDHEDYDLYIRWNIVDKRCEEIQRTRKLVRVNYLLSMCVDVVSGEHTVDDVEWIERLGAAFDNFEVPTDKGKRHLLFLKHVVITTADEFELIINLCTSPEVTMQGIINALRGFQDTMEERGHN